MKKMVMMIWCAAAALLSAACSKEALDIAPRNGGGDGSLLISAVAMPQITEYSKTRADAEEPATKELTELLGNAAAKFTQEWAMASLRTRVVCLDEDVDGLPFASANDYNYENPRLSPAPAKYNVTMGTVTATRKRLPPYTAPDGSSITAEDAPAYRRDHTDSKLVPQVAEGEGVDYIYFEGWNTVDVEAEKTTSVDVTVRVANTAVTVEFTPAFRNYFANGATVTLTTKYGQNDANGLKGVEIASYTADTEPTKHIYWVRPQQFTLSAVATPQHPSSILQAEPVELTDVVRNNDQVAPQTLYKFVYDVTNTGALDGSLTITVNDEPVGTIDLGSEETNPNDDNYGKEE